jgi:hypothetical protein
MATRRVAEVVRERNTAFRGSNDVEKFREVVDVFTPASYGEHVLGEMKYVVHLPVVGVKNSLNKAPRAFDYVRMSPSTFMREIRSCG